MFIHPLHLLATTASLALATNLFVSDYSGNITTLSLTESAGHYLLTETSSTTDCAPNPSWLTLDANHGTLYCLDEGLEVTNGSLTSFTISPSGVLTKVHREDTINGPVSGVIYGNPAKQRAIALAHYVGSAISTWNIDVNNTGTFDLNQDITFTLPSPGPNPVRQDSPHEHEAILDPTGQYILVPDLGADLVRIFSIDPKTNSLTPSTPLKVLPGSGPRHAVFYNPYGVSGGNSSSFLFVVTELGNTVTSYAVRYLEQGGLRFEQVYNSTTFGEVGVPDGNAAAEIAISPDNRFLIISNRNNTFFHLPSLPSSTSTNSTTFSTSTKIPSDSLTTFSLNKDGTLNPIQIWPAGGMFPRHFSMNKVGDLVAVGLQYDRSVVVFERDVVGGGLGRPVARWIGNGNVTCVVWDE